MEFADINYALVEDVRPPIYTAMKYWGKKPHNIWREYIQHYTPEDGIFLDPFAGSAISAFEAIKVKRKAIAFDLNPLTSFIIEVLVSNFDKKAFESEVTRIIQKVEDDEIYKQNFIVKSRHTGELTSVVCYKWNNKDLYETGIYYTDNEVKKILNKNVGKKRYAYRAGPDDVDILNAKEQEKINIPYWFPDQPFHKSPSFSANFLNAIGGNNFSNLWTKRNLYVLSLIFNEILQQKDEILKKQLLFGFIQSVHLCSKMSVPRNPKSNRDFSTSWGRSAYLSSARKMEMNALVTFRSSCLGKQSVESSLNYARKYLGNKPKILNIGLNNKQKQKLTGFDLKYGVVDVNAITDYVPDNSVDFIMTDPPYGGLVQYLDLSSIWLNWLKKYDERFEPNYNAEITVKSGLISVSTYRQLFTNAMKNLHRILKTDGKIVFTFHNKNLQVWNAFLNSLTISGFTIEKVIHQQNRRTGEANVANPYGTSGTDFYIRCIKTGLHIINNDIGEFEHFVLKKAIELIASRNEPTPYLILFNGLLAEISSAGFDLEDFDSNIEQILSKHIGTIFKLTDNETNKAGNYWWFITPKNYIKYPDRLLTDRVEDTILMLLRRKTSVTFDQALAEIFIKYPNGLTPDIKSIDQVLKKFASPSQGRWLYRQLEIEAEISRHTYILKLLSEIGKKLGYKIFIGKREQPEQINGKHLAEFADYTNLNFLNYNKEVIERIEMIDMIWFDGEEIKYVLEVENTTNFTSGVQRASNVDAGINKLMIIPDKREVELKNLSDPLFTENFKNYNWKYAIYTDMEKLTSVKKLDLNTLKIFLK